MINQNKDDLRILQNKGFGIPQVYAAEHVITEEINHRHFIDSVQLCENCQLNSCDTESKVLGAGPITSPIMIITDSPTQDDIGNNLPLTGVEGTFLTMALQVLKVDRRSVYITSSVKCRTTGTPSPDEIATCRPYLEYEINRVRPQVIISLGNTATKAVTNKYETNISKARGCFFELPGSVVYPTWHPSYILQLSGVDYIKARDQFIFDVENAVNRAKELSPSYKWIF